MKENISEVLTVEEFAALIKIHPNTVRHQIRLGRIIAFKTGGGSRSPYRIFKSELMRMAAFDATQMIDNIVNERLKKV